MHFAASSHGGVSSTLLLTANALGALRTDGLSHGDEVAVIADNGLCAGAAVWNGGNLAITVWGDDPMTEGVDGLADGEHYRLKIMDIDTGRVSELSPLYSLGEGHFTANGLTVIDGLSSPTGSNSTTAQPLSYSLSQNSPNPFNPVTSITFTLPNEASVRLTVYNMTGEKVAVLTDAAYPAGKHEVDWRAGKLSSGVYFYRLEAGAFSETKKMMLLK